MSQSQENKEQLYDQQHTHVNRLVLGMLKTIQYKSTTAGLLIGMACGVVIGFNWFAFWGSLPWYAWLTLGLTLLSGLILIGSINLTVLEARLYLLQFWRNWKTADEILRVKLEEHDKMSENIGAQTVGKYFRNGDGRIFMHLSYCELPTATMEDIASKDQVGGAVGSLNLSTFTPLTPEESNILSQAMTQIEHARRKKEASSDGNT